MVLPVSQVQGHMKQMVPWKKVFMFLVMLLQKDMPRKNWQPVKWVGKKRRKKTWA